MCRSFFYKKKKLIKASPEGEVGRLSLLGEVYRQNNVAEFRNHR